MNDLVAIMELRKAKSACLFSGRVETLRCALSLTRYAVLTYNLFTECLHLINDYRRMRRRFFFGVLQTPKFQAEHQNVDQVLG